MIKNIYLPSTHLDIYKTERFVDDSTGISERMLSNINRLNVFIGVNNSGKSRFLRDIFSQKNFKYDAVDNLFQTAHSIKERLLAEVSKLLENDPHNTRLKEMREYSNSIQVPEKPNLEENPWEQLKNYITLFHQNGVVKAFQQLGNETQLSYQNLKEIIRELNDLKVEIELKAKNFKQPKFVYIPTLRSLNLASGDSDSFYERIKQNYFINIDKGDLRASLKRSFDQPDNDNIIRNEIFTGLTVYDGLKDYLLGERKKRLKIQEFEKFLGASFFDGQDITLIPHNKDKIIYIKIGKEKERPIYQLGDGIAQIIILTFPLIIFKEQPLFLFIEEPELFCHPGLQNLFIKSISNYENANVFVVTHSPQFLDITLESDDVSVFKVKKNLSEHEEDCDSSIMISRVSNKDFNLLRELGIKNSSVMLSNCTIWVEGITDRLYFQHFLNLLLKTKGKNEQFQVDRHFSFVEYGGSNITHWSFLDDYSAHDTIDVERLCGELFLIADNDNGTKKKRTTKIKKFLKKNFFQLKCREVENLLTPKTLIEIIKYSEGEEVKLKDFKQEDYRSEYLGTFIEKNILPSKNKKSYSGESGTIKDKVNFATKAIKTILTFDDLSPDAKEVAHKIFEFIKNKNK